MVKNHRWKSRKLFIHKLKYLSSKNLHTIDLKVAQKRDNCILDEYGKTFKLYKLQTKRNNL